MELLKFARLSISLKSVQNNTEPVCLLTFLVCLFFLVCFFVVFVFMLWRHSMTYRNSRKLKNSGFGWKTFLPLQERQTSQSIIIFTIQTPWLDLQCSGEIFSVSFIEKSHYFLDTHLWRDLCFKGTQSGAVPLFSKGLSLFFLPAERRYRELVPGLLCGILSSDYYPYSPLLSVQKEKWRWLLSFIAYRKHEMHL